MDGFLPYISIPARKIFAEIFRAASIETVRITRLRKLKKQSLKRDNPDVAR